MPTLDELQPPKPIIDASEEDWRSIEESLGLEPDPWFRNRLANYVLLYLDPVEAALPRARPSQMRRQFEIIKTDTEQLIADLRFEENGEENDIDSWAQAYAVFSALRQSERETLLKNLTSLVEHTDGLLQSLPPDRGGRLADERLPGLIRTLATEYFELKTENPTNTYAWRRNQYQGHFLNFVEAVLKVFAPELIKSNQALGSQTKRALADWRTRMGKDNT